MLAESNSLPKKLRAIYQKTGKAQEANVLKKKKQVIKEGESKTIGVKILKWAAKSFKTCCIQIPECSAYICTFKW